MADVSVLMASYNHEPFLEDAIGSVIAQTYDDWELIVVDDCSTDGSWSVINRFDDPRIIASRMPQNSGGTLTHNEALSRATGRIIMTIDSDDVFEPTKIERQVAYLDAHPEIGIVATHVRSCPNSPAVDDWFNREVDPNDPAAWLWSNLLAHSSVALTRGAQSAIGTARPDLTRTPDWDLWLRALSNGVTIAIIPEALTTIRVNPHSVTHADPIGTAREYLTISRDYWHDHLRANGRDDLIVKNLELALERLVTLRTPTTSPLALLVEQLIAEAPEGPAAIVAFAQRQSRLRSAKDAALATQAQMIDERAELLANYEDTIATEREGFARQLSDLDAHLAVAATQLHHAQERLGQLAPLEDSPRVQLGALRRTAPASIRKRVRRIRRHGVPLPDAVPVEQPPPQPDAGLAAVLATDASLQRMLRDMIGDRFDLERDAIDAAVRVGTPLVDPPRSSDDAADPQPEADLNPSHGTLHESQHQLEGPLAELIALHPADLWSFDIWDTLIERRRPPDAAKTATARRMLMLSQDLPGTRGRTTFELAKIRTDVEAHLASVTTGEEYELEDVLARTLERLGMPRGLRCTGLAAELAELEVGDEIRWSVPRPGIAQLTTVPDRDKVLISDFYMRGHHLSRIVREVADCDLDVIVSVDRGVSKRIGGQLLEQVRTERQVVASRHVHVGDNPYSDVAEQVRGGGIAIHVARSPQFAGAGAFTAENLDECWAALTRQLTEFSRSTGTSVASRRAGHRLAPLAALLAARGIEEAHRSGVDRVHYASREGLFLKRVHDEIAEILSPPGSEPVAGVHLQMSRRSTFGASLAEPFHLALQRMWSMYANQTVEAMLVSIGVDPEECALELAAAGLTRDTQLTDAGTDPRIHALLHDRSFLAILRERVNANRALLTDYVRSQTVLTDPFILTDIGWRGTIQDNLTRALEIHSVVGIYVGLFPFLNAQPFGSRKVGIAFDGNAGDEFGFAEPPAALERPWTPHVPSTIGYARDGDRVVPVLAREAGAVSDSIAEFQAGVVEAAPMVAQWLVGMGLTVDLLTPQLARLARSVWLDPPEGLADIWFESDHDDSFGALNVVAFGKDRPGPDWYTGALRDHVRRGEELSGWPAGYRSWRPVRAVLDLAQVWSDSR